MTDYAQALASVEAYTAETLATFPERTPYHRVDWTREGLAALFHRLEDLKIAEVEIGMIYDAATRTLAGARRMLKDLANQEHDVIADSVSSRAGDLVSRGMAAEERMMVHRTRAIDTGLWRRRFETAVDDVDTICRLANTRHFAISAEREDTRAQIRAINVAIELGEI